MKSNVEVKSTYSNCYFETLILFPWPKAPAQALHTLQTMHGVASSDPVTPVEQVARSSKCKDLDSGEGKKP